VTATDAATRGDSQVGGLLRHWRELRRLSQLDLAGQAEVSTRHLSYLETGRSRPSREMVLHLAEQLEVPLRQRNELLLAAGYAPVYTETSLESPGMAAVREALGQVLASHDPYPALVVDRDWNLLLANDSVRLFTDLVDPALLRPPVNVLRLSLHPDGMAPHTLNLAQWREHILLGLQRRISAGAPPEVSDLYEELHGYPGSDADPPLDGPVSTVSNLVVPLRLRDARAGELMLFTTIATFGAPRDITLAEIAIETFFPADAHTAEVLRSRAA
jgi:transcriptional regulator with XRE-family HTH domain